MKASKEMTKNEMKSVIGGTYYGNGVSCGKTTCTVDWAAAGTCIAQISIGGFLGGAIPGKC
ncbi:Blp family class II bacteriocin [Enterococcus pallens]|uniref:Bacteriocin-type signal sequence n=1 Tax=Enterococcus pallens ATCC BAA-351 TaxID=1158607 RepID=R2SRR0_9ENTE|nr:leucocin A/sakacin P family class II bacteriocin [Enterococcus pallens]EOH90809.1 bacteriocin-type signal sequence [Enterococcus pallens ATCC BAA-351]EOU16005.1 bacteriocin EntA [Enterococcus pallens ATCC BAA-351]